MRERLTDANKTVTFLLVNFSSKDIPFPNSALESQKIRYKLATIFCPFNNVLITSSWRCGRISCVSEGS